MAVWTLAWQEGVPGEQVARELADAAGVDIVDDEALVDRAQALGLRRCRVDPRVPGGLERLGLSLAFCLGAMTHPIPPPGSLADVAERRATLLREAAREGAVITAWGAFAVLGDHRGALHARLHAPLPWRVARYGVAQVVGQGVATADVRRAERQQRCFLRRAHGCDLEDPSRFALACDVSRLRLDAVVAMLLEAADRARVAA